MKRCTHLYDCVHNIPHIVYWKKKIEFKLLLRYIFMPLLSNNVLDMSLRSVDLYLSHMHGNLIQRFVSHKLIGKKKPEKIRASTGFEPVTSAIPVRCSTNWAMKPHIGSEVNLLSSYLPVQWNDVKCIWNNSYLNCGCGWKWRMIIAVKFPI